MKKFAILLPIFITSCLYLKAQDSLQQYGAKYKFPQGSIVNQATVILENGILQLNSSIGKTALEKTGNDQFSTVSYNGTVVFLRNSAKKITGMRFDVMNISLEGLKVENSGSSDYEEVKIPMKIPLPMMPGDY